MIKILERKNEEELLSNSDELYEEHLTEEEDYQTIECTDEDQQKVINEFFEDHSETEAYVDLEETSQTVVQETEPLPRVVEENCPDLKRAYPCLKCSEVFVSPQLLAFHNVKHDSSKKQQKIEKISYVPMLESKQDENGRFVCHICQGTYKSRDNLSRHIVKHISERNFKCELCPREFYFQRDLNGHVKQQHSEKRQKFQCDECLCKFTTSSALKKHLLTHKAEKSFNCDQCNQKFKSKGTLQNHYRIHSGIRPYICTKCSKAFTQKIVLQRHMKSVHDKFIYDCKWCSLSFEKHGELREHWKECESLKTRGGYEVIFVSQDEVIDEPVVHNFEVEIVED